MHHIETIQEEFERRYPEEFDWIYRYIVLRVHHQADSEDIAANVFLSAYRNIGQFNALRGNLRQWLTGIARRAIIDYWRGRDTHSALEHIEHLVDGVSEQTEDRLDDRLAVEKILHSLSPEHRALFILRFVDGMTYEEIASVTERHPTALRSVFSRTIRKLREQYS